MRRRIFFFEDIFAPTNCIAGGTLGANCGMLVIYYISIWDLHRVFLETQSFLEKNIIAIKFPLFFSINIYHI